jgi:hypothetical protein
MAFLLLVPVLILALLLWSFYTYGVLRGNKFILWLGLFLIGVGTVCSGIIEVSPTSKVLVLLWSYSIVGLPLWWCGRAMWKARRQR